MKRNLFFLLTVCCSVLFTSCHDDHYDFIAYSRTYYDNYYLKNATDTELTFRYNSYGQVKDHIVMDPGSSVIIRTAMNSVGYTKYDPIVEPTQDYMIEIGQTYTLYNEDNKEGVDAYFLKGNTKYILDINKDDGPLAAKNYDVKVVNDTTFNFYFTIDEAYLSTLRVEE